MSETGYIHMDQETITLSHDFMIDILEHAITKENSLSPNSNPELIRSMATQAVVIMMQSYRKQQREELD